MQFSLHEAGGHQFWVEPKRFIELNKLFLKPGSTILIRRILFARKGEQIFVGKPYLSDIKIEAVVSKHFKGPKVIVYKMKPKKKYRRKTGHRQHLTRLYINSIN